MTHPEPKTIAIIGAGPVGLAAAAHALERGLKPVVFEAGPAAGHAISQWGHVRMFSPWEYNIDTASARLLATVGWNSPDPEVYPTGGDLVAAYIAPLATRTALAKHIKTNAEVRAISRVGFDKLKTEGPRECTVRDPLSQRQGTRDVARGRRHRRVRHMGRVRIQPALEACPPSARLSTHRGSPTACPTCSGRERARYAGKTVAVLGAGHSAVGTLIDLAALERQRRPRPKSSGCCAVTDPRNHSAAAPTTSLPRAANSARYLRGSCAAAHAGRNRFQRDASRASGWAPAHRRRLGAAAAVMSIADELIVATGFRPDMSIPRELRLVARSGARMPAGAGAADRSQRAQLRHRAPARRARTGTARARLLLRRHEILRPRADVPDADRLRAGPLDRRRNRRRHEAAARVELVLPETGVCSRPGRGRCRGLLRRAGQGTQSACCAADEAESTPDCGCAARACCG